MWWALLATTLFEIVGRLGSTALRYLGVGAVSYYGINFVVGELKDYVLANFITAPPLVLHILGLMKVDIAINIILGAVTTRIILAGIDKAADMRRNPVWRKPNPSGQGSIDA
ncbi:MAG: hypothetical protein ACI9EB_000546 [Pseudomonas sp.]|jgi:hypothetical protein